jgi:hypothetical protein
MFNEVTHADNVQLVVNMAMGCLVAAGMLWLTILARDWRGIMSRKQRRQRVMEDITYEYVSLTEDKVADETITREEAIEVYRNLKKCFPIPSLYPSVELLKEAIRKRQGTFIEPKLPDVPAKPKLKHAFDKS